MAILIHKTYPTEIKNHHKLIVAVKIIPCGLPKEGPKHCAFSTPFAIAYAANVFDLEGVDVHYWDWYYCPDPDQRQEVDNYVRSADLNPNQWYFLDVFDGEENE